MPFEEHPLDKSIKKENAKRARIELDTRNATRSAKLLRAIYKANGVYKRTGPRQDPNYYVGIQKLKLHQKELHDDHKRLDKVIDWYCEHIKDKGVVKVTSHGGFCQLFLEIERTMERWYKKHPPKLKVSHTTRVILDYMGIPGNDSIKQMVEISVRNVTQLFTWINDNRHELGLDWDDNCAPNVDEFLVEYFSGMIDWAITTADTDDWTKKIDPIQLAFRNNTARFAKTMKTWGRDIGMEPELVHKIIQGANECVSMK